MNLGVGGVEAGFSEQLRNFASLVADTGHTWINAVQETLLLGGIVWLPHQQSEHGQKEKHLSRKRPFYMSEGRNCERHRHSPLEAIILFFAWPGWPPVVNM